MRLIEDYSKIPFADPGDIYQMNANKGRRVRIFKEIIGDTTGLKTLDVGPQNLFGELLGLQENTYPTDLNHEVYAPSSEYDLIVCSELLEHVMNPLFLMEKLRGLCKHNGRVILATPKRFPFWNTSPKHLTEYQKDRLEILFRYAGFKIGSYRTIRIWDWWFAFTGFRPFIRTVFTRSHLWELYAVR